MLWEVDIYPAPGQPDVVAEQVRHDGLDLGIHGAWQVAAGRGYLVEGDFTHAQVQRLAEELFADPVVERFVIGQAGDSVLLEPPGPDMHPVYVLPKPGVMDPVAMSAAAAIEDFGWHARAVRTFRKYWFSGLSHNDLRRICQKILANDAIEQVIFGPLPFRTLEQGRPYEFRLITVPLREMDDQALLRLSREGQLFLSLVEMRTIRDFYRSLGRDPTDVELETLAQTWSEHCSHKTLTGQISYRDEQRQIQFQNMLKETIFAATHEIRRRLGDRDWCVSVFEDNAGVVKFDDDYHVVFKVETHNHPSALEPYGGANTGIGGVIRDPMGTGLGAKPICNTDVFCFAPPDISHDELPPGVLHPRRVMKGVVAGVRDYGNRMGIPTVNGAVYFDRRYLGNPLVYCGNVGLLPRDKAHKAAQPGDLIVLVGGRTGRDGIHGATFSSAELTTESETLSGGAVQIGNAITEKMLLDVLLVARDRGLYHAVTDCGAGGLSSAVGEMGRAIGAEVDLERVPLKYEGLSYAEIWISEAQERMVLAVPEEKWPELQELFASEGVEATAIGRFVPTGRLVLRYQGHQVADLSMEFLHKGRPAVVREAVYAPASTVPMVLPPECEINWTADLIAILGSLNVCSKEWIIRQYDHEVQGGSAIKPLVGRWNDGPSDAAVLRPVLSSYRGLVIACGMNPKYGDYDTYWMAAAAIDEAVRNCVAVGADPSRIAILDNFCWGNTDRPEVLGSLVRAALACHDVAVALGTPFISGKDSLNNEFRLSETETITIPPSLLISALGQVDDVRRCVTMDLKQPGNAIYIVGTTADELGGSHWAEIHGLSGGTVPRWDGERARGVFEAMHRAIMTGCVRACHDLSEGGLAVAIAEMAFAGEFGAEIDLDAVPCASSDLGPVVRLFSESNSRFLCEVPVERASAFEGLFAGLPIARLGTVQEKPHLVVKWRGQTLIDTAVENLKRAWKQPLAW
ncbi:Phosphoribosylformylglycinamidine synthase, PurS subunit [Thermogutta terrifontis]|uniref:Phosphoribosylformylglycinamidine synthase subunit PurL n=1 Tax=Thermogutta terrifontis TaxID=1331910 RepID=A0A286RA09_9BACT|nr:phosphoribosylformylglycinamidine synthase subunit PurL [Thermogutta terrifontis]ASV72789.1 Phosphoribosylformylglycinamidine synthase, PurS subunit [Thermogutta terrifontis]